MCWRELVQCLCSTGGENGWRRRGEEDNDEEKEEVHRDAHRPSLPILKTTHAIFVSCVEDLLSTSALACANNVRTVELEETLQLAPYLCSVHQHVVFQGWVDLWTFTYNYTCELSIPALNGPSIYNCVLVNLTPQLEALCQASDRGTLCLLKVLVPRGRAASIRFLCLLSAHMEHRVSTSYLLQLPKPSRIVHLCF